MTPLKEWLKRNHIKQAELASVAGVDHAHVCRVANGQSRPSQTLRAYLAENCADALEEHEAWAMSNLATVKKKIREAA